MHICLPRTSLVAFCSVIYSVLASYLAIAISSGGDHTWADARTQRLSRIPSKYMVDFPACAMFDCEPSNTT